MNDNDKRTLSEVISYYNDWDGELEESLFNWVIEKIESQQKEIEGLRIAIEAERGFINSFYQNRIE